MTNTPDLSDRATATDHDTLPTDLLPPPGAAVWRQTLLHWLFFLSLMTALIGGAALIF
ncbi:hypothetical protein [Paracoccus aestuarii]|uniref:hypothetical protein n=1 Tax=Paracoccus aestuarii TaxID=453842 RepID=UPI00147407CC|nr:hypothetical protein [Paracoccus aestuarii]WCQ98338.1 hypothetical protein JHW48_10365 [Paracoccus aestuarii]